jgi:hypothetical protein
MGWGQENVTVTVLIQSGGCGVLQNHNTRSLPAQQNTIHRAKATFGLNPLILTRGRLSNSGCRPPPESL